MPTNQPFVRIEFRMEPTKGLLYRLFGHASSLDLGGEAKKKVFFCERQGAVKNGVSKTPSQETKHGGFSEIGIINILCI